MRTYLPNQLKPSELKDWRENRLKANCGNCDLCGNPCVAPCVDHAHDKEGRVRGVICRACNSVIAVIDKGTRYGKDFDKLAFAKGLYDYLTNTEVLPIHPSVGKPKKRRRVK